MENNYVMLSEGNKKYLLPVENILRMEAERAYTIFYSKDGKQYVYPKTLGAVQKLLMHRIFFRVHRQHIINLREVRFLQDARCPSVVLSNNAVIAVAQRRRTELIRMLKKLR